MPKIKPLNVPIGRKINYLQIFCYKCRTNITKGICKKTGKPIIKCPHGDRHVFKIYVPVAGTKNQRRTKVLSTRNLDEAIAETIKFKQEVKGETASEKINIEKQEKMNKANHNENRPYLLGHFISRYSGWLRNENLPEHRKKIRSEEYVNDVDRALILFANCQAKNGYDVTKMRMEDFNDEMVGHVYVEMKDRRFSNRTVNKYLTYYTAFINWVKEEFDVPVKNYFVNVERMTVNHNPQGITRKEYEELLKIITPESGIKYYQSGIKHRRDYYEPWLADSIRLGLETGARREELISMRWGDIKEEDGAKYIMSENFKVNHIKKLTTEAEKKYLYFPVTEDLENLLNELGYNKNKNSDSYILAPEIAGSRNRTMCDAMSRGFTHYYDSLKTEKKLTFKSLRKTYFTSLKIFMLGNENIIKITGHSSNQVLDKNYFIQKEIAKAMRNFRIFPMSEGRMVEIREIRIETENVNKNVKREVER